MFRWIRSALCIGCGVLLLFFFFLSAFPPIQPAFSEQENGIAVPILMYHSILNDASKAGKYIITPDELENDLKYLKKEGYETVFVQDLIDSVYHGKSLPKKPVLLTFDDGNYNNLTYAYPLLEKYDMKGVISIIGRYTDLYSESNEPQNNCYSNLTWEELKFLSQSGRIEILNHSYDMHGPDSRMGLIKVNGESEEKYLKAIDADLSKMQNRMKEMLGFDSCAFTYPFGKISDSAETHVEKMGFLATLSCYERVNHILPHQPECLYQLGRFNRPSGISAEEIFKKNGAA